MNNNLLLSLAVTLIPLLALCYVAVLLTVKIYVKIRSRFNVGVNCWFCNQNSRAPYLEANSWTCPHCEQYNGFTKDGDYNREIFQQLDCSGVSSNGSRRYDYSAGNSSCGSAGALFASRRPALPPRNGFCNGCNEAQRLKVEKLAQFEPKNESHFDAEIKVYKAQLEEQYRLCATCDRHLNKVLREKKKMVLGSKFLDFIIKGAETLKQPHFTQIRLAQQQHWKRRLVLLIALLTALNVCCLLRALPPWLTRDSLSQAFGQSVGHTVFIALSHVVALGRVLGSYLDALTQHASVLKLQLFCRTLLMMALYSMGLKWPQVAGFNFVSLFVLACPFAILALAFAHNIADGFRLTRYTLLLVLWSVFAGGLVGDQLLLSQDILMFIASLTTLFLTATTKSESCSPKLHDSTGNSFHKLYSEDYLSDDETMSMLSQQLNCSASAASIRSSGNATQRSFYRAASPTLGTSFAHQARHAGYGLPAKSPVTSSVLSLNQLSQAPQSADSVNHAQRAQFSPNTSFQSFCLNDSQNYASAAGVGSMYNQPLSPHYGSALELNSCRERPQATLFGRSANLGAANYSFGNASFAAPHTPSFYGAASLRAAAHSPFAGATVPPPLLHSPFSASSNAVYPSQRTASGLLTPSRFGTNCMAPSAVGAASSVPSVATSWLSGGYFNQRQAGGLSNAPTAVAEAYRNGGGLTAIDENLSRASSQSSGFESQHGGARGLHAVEESFSATADTHDLPPLNKSFQSIANGVAHGSAFAPLSRYTMSSNAPLPSPLAVNCSESSWQAAAAPTAAPQSLLMRRQASGRDSFNLRRINDELPTLKRGDLLKKWAQSQQAATSS